MENFEDQLKETIGLGSRKQDTLNPRKFRYTMAFSDLVNDNTHIVAIVLFTFRSEGRENPTPNNYIVTAFQKETG